MAKQASKKVKKTRATSQAKPSKNTYEDSDSDSSSESEVDELKSKRPGRPAGSGNKLKTVPAIAIKISIPEDEIEHHPFAKINGRLDSTALSNLVEFTEGKLKKEEVKIIF